MCGVVGILGASNLTDAEINLFKGLLLVDQIRGAHATGVIKVDTKENTAKIHKKALDAVDFLALEETKTFLDKDRTSLLIGHNRYATMGNKGKDENAHPFNHEHITMVHNGGVETFALDLLEGYTDPAVEVDSHMVCMTIAKHGAKKAVEELLFGAFTLIWWDEKERSLNFIRNEDRPLFIAITTKGSLVWASEEGMLDVFLKRSGRYSDYKSKPVSLEPNKLLTIRFDERGNRLGNMPVMQDMAFQEYVYPKSAAAYTAWWGSAGSSSQSQKASNVVNIASGVNIKKNYDEQTRINNNLDRMGCAVHRHRSLVTFDITKVEPYMTNPSSCNIVGVCINTNRVITAWGLNTEEARKYQTLRGNVSNAYILNGIETITVDNVGVSCHDPKYSWDTNSVLATASSTLNPSTSRGKEASEIAAELLDLQKVQQAQRKEVEANQVSKAKKPRVTLPAVKYPLKVNGATFSSVSEFREFVSRGCSLCGDVPTAYDLRNNELTVCDGNSLSSSLEDSEFICGKCEGAV